MAIVQRKDAVRMLFTDGPGNNDLVRDNPGKVFCLIGPFENHGDKRELEDALTLVVRGFNFHPK